MIDSPHPGLPSLPGQGGNTIDPSRLPIPQDGEEMLQAQAKLLSNERALIAFHQAAVNEDLWRQAEEDPRGFLNRMGVEIPDILEVSFQSQQSTRPWPPAPPELQLVTLRCWWVWGKSDKDEAPKPPTLFCLEVPTFLLKFLQR